MKHLVCLIAVVFFCSNLYSQQSSLNLYSNWSYFPNLKFSHIDNGDSKIGYNGLSFSYRRVNENLTFHEFELKSGLRFKSENEIDNKRFYNHFRYEIGKQKKEKLFNKINFQYGLALKLFHLYQQTDQQAPNLFESTQHTIGLNTGLVTNFEYDISEKFSIQLKATLINMAFAGGVSKTDRPDIPEDQRSNFDIDIDYFGEQSLRFGIGYKIGKM